MPGRAGPTRMRKRRSRAAEEEEEEGRPAGDFSLPTAESGSPHPTHGQRHRSASGCFCAQSRSRMGDAVAFLVERERGLGDTDEREEWRGRQGTRPRGGCGLSGVPRGREGSRMRSIAGNYGQERIAGRLTMPEQMGGESRVVAL
ncbi:hypothetical protein AXG93_3271s1060 [Marchantia polymorpha subsp. ruderalis]|uniref:Uncharacterized protein n=1 Tax=Marchantia polymorpha subsp. ruderalis TaxID=1480154 RepID=A0A176VP41_MARPO|nr:hypothetical protein AXG93_3271s1060 [Marchantia polymorpha subsp. ruderalis]